ncbi:UPF0389 protein CG9231-like isoform X2 [Artemia franciscana]|uniref:UPF0389 protein CG9231-like isoform X2 n=1 Tax=Artemia franciscana TaxID=6661 RepID=UPI0032DBDFA4
MHKIKNISMSTVLRRCLLVRNRSLRWQSSEPKNQAAESANDTSPGKGLNLGSNHRVNKLEKYMLVYTKRFPSVDSVPNFVTQEMMERTRNIVRIRVNIAAIALMLLAALVASFSGKEAKSRGETIEKLSEDWKRSLKKE